MLMWKDSKKLRWSRKHNKETNKQQQQQQQNNNKNINNDTWNLFRKPEKNWRVEITAGSKSFAELKIHRGIFQGDALSPLKFVIAIIQLNHIVNAQSDTNFIIGKKKKKILITKRIWTTSNCLLKMEKNWKL